MASELAALLARQEKVALYFGCRDRAGHYLHFGRDTLWDTSDVPGFPWTLGHLDTGLLTNGKHPDLWDGKVFWTCGGNPLWLAFFWWDNSVDRRSGANAGFYVRGFNVASKREAFDYACSAYPWVAARQRQPLLLVAEAVTQEKSE